MRTEYLASISDRDEKDVLRLLRRFLIPTCTLPLDEITLSTVSSVKDPPTEQHRRFLCGEPAWEGLTWVIDLLEQNPGKAIEVLETYMKTHIQMLDRGYWLWRLQDAILLIRGKWIEIDHPRELLLKLGGHKFEHLIANLYSRMGYKTTLTKGSHDGGVDIRASSLQSGQRHTSLIQCKCVSKNVGVRVIRELHAVVEDAKAPKGLLVTTANFTPAAKKWAENNPRLELIDVTSLIRLLNQHIGHNWVKRIDLYCSDLYPKIVASDDGTDS